MVPPKNDYYFHLKMAEKLPRSSLCGSSENSTGTIDLPVPHLTFEVSKDTNVDTFEIFRFLFKQTKGLKEVVSISDARFSPNNINCALPSGIPPYALPAGEITAPYLAVMLFIPESGPTSTLTVRTVFEKPPWRHHHTIQLQRSGSSMVLGKQEFYSLSRQMPLWSVCPSPYNSHAVRFNLFVRRYDDMVEFYRLVTNTEMESQKPGFSIFPLHRTTSPFHSGSATTRYELALKQCSLVTPYPLHNAYLTFPVQNLQALLTILPSQARALSLHDYLVHDPDGNALILRDARVPDVHSVISAPLTTKKLPLSARLIVDKGSLRSDSVDSGTFSDFDACSSELSHLMSKLCFYEL